MPKLDPNAIPTQSGVLEYFRDARHGWLEFEPISKVVRQPKGKKPIVWPIALPEQLIGTDQPQVPTCSLPGPNNKGCPKALKCPIANMGLKHLGPGYVIMRKLDAVSQMSCHDFFGADDAQGRPLYQINYGEQGWKMDTSITTVPIMGSEHHYNAQGQKTGTSHVEWEKEVPDLLPYWWPLLKKQGKPLPAAAKRFPQFVEDDEEESSTESGSPAPSPSVSTAGPKKQRRAVKRKARASRSARSAQPSWDTPAPDA